MNKIFELQYDRVLKLLSPFDNNYSNYDFKLSKNDIYNFNYDCVKNDDDIKTKSLNRIIFLINNPDKIKPCYFNFDKAKEESFVIEDIENLYASLYLKKEVLFSSNKEYDYLKEVFGEIKEKEYNNIKEIKFDWVFLDEPKDEIKSFFEMVQNGAVKSKVKEYIESLPEDIWENEEFLQKYRELFDKNPRIKWQEAMSMIPEKVFYTENIYKFLKSSKEFDEALFLYVVNKEKTKDLNVYLEEDFFNNKNNIVLLITKEVDRPFYYKEKFKDKIKNINKEIINDYDFLSQIAKYNLIDFYPYINKELFNDDKVIDLFMNNQVINELNIVQHKNVFHWMKDKGKILSMYEKHPSFFRGKNNYLYSNLSYDLKNDKDICLLFIGVNNELFEQLPVECQKDLDIVRNYLQNGGKPHMLTKDFIFKNIMKNDKELFKLICQKDIDYLLHERCLKEFSEDFELMRNIPFHLFPLPKIEKICKKLSDYKDILETNSVDFYHYFPKKVKEELALDFLFEVAKSMEYAMNVSHLTNSVPSHLWWNEDFLIESLNDAPVIFNAIKENIPKEMWTSRKFILNLCTLIDEQKIKYDKLPFKIQDFLNKHHIDNNFRTFMASYFEKLDFNENIKINNKEKKMKI